MHSRHAHDYNFSDRLGQVNDRLKVDRQPGRAASSGALTGAAIHIPDVLADPEYAYSDIAEMPPAIAPSSACRCCARTKPIGVICFVGRKTVDPSPRNRSSRLQTFADQAVIAIENVRLFDEVQAKTRDLDGGPDLPDRQRQYPAA